jgi:hypothetical protein
VQDWQDRCARLPSAAREEVRRRLGVPPGPLARALREGGWCQADAVLALLRAGRDGDAERLVGRRIMRLPSGMPPWPPLPAPRRERGPDDRRITAVGQCPYRKGGRAKEGWELFRPGRTVAEYLRRGGTRRLLREAVSSGAVSLEGGR